VNILSVATCLVNWLRLHGEGQVFEERTAIARLKKSQMPVVYLGLGKLYLHSTMLNCELTLRFLSIHLKEHFFFFFRRMKKYSFFTEKVYEEVFFPYTNRTSITFHSLSTVELFFQDI
jgi:hypothetical protein